MDISRIPRQPLVKVPVTASVHDTVTAMVAVNVGSAAIVEGKGLAGIFTERDLMKRVVAPGKDPKATRVSEVMTRNVKTLPPDAEAVEALRFMLEWQFRHTPITDGEGNILGMLSLRDLLRYQVEELDRELNSVVERFTNDASGG